MTGYGRGESTGAGRSFTVEAQSLNHRYLEVRARLPRRLTGLELRTQQEVQRRFARGHFDITVSERLTGQRPRTLRVDEGLAAAYMEALRKLQSIGGLQGELTLDHLAAQRDLLIHDEEEESLETAWADLRPALLAALDAMEAMRAREGQALEREIVGRLGAVDALLGQVQERVPRVARAQKERLQARVAELLDGRPLEPGRLEQEAALLADRADVREECVRLGSHLAQFRALLGEGGSQGRRFDFLLQEMNREANTIGSKSADAEISHLVVAMKAELEKIREQVQNVE
ncbi:MAG TPA: YicC/YloC family endoribonuclease [Candidatus Sulfotelmatobacter sp.]|nr:YicC/YloC family endoribonuclease [Candidatus Sulfotelmatobacter sp.]